MPCHSSQFVSAAELPALVPGSNPAHISALPVLTEVGQLLAAMPSSAAPLGATRTMRCPWRRLWPPEPGKTSGTCAETPAAQRLRKGVGGVLLPVVPTSDLCLGAGQERPGEGSWGGGVCSIAYHSITAPGHIGFSFPLLGSAQTAGTVHGAAESRALSAGDSPWIEAQSRALMLITGQ